MTAPTKPASAPVHEIGYQQAVGQYMWWLYENETTPELIWPQSVYVYDQMRRTDSQVGSILRAVNLLVLRTPWRIDPNGARAEVVELVANDLGLPIVGQSPKAPPRTKDRFSWKDHLTEALLMLPLGYSYFEQVYRVDPDGGRAHLRKLALRPARTIEYVNVADDGGLISIKQYWVRSGERPQPIPVDHLVAYIHAKEGGNWLGTSILRNCYKNWLLKDRLLRVQAQTIERNGMGIPLYTGPEGATDLSAGLAMAKAWRAGEAAGSAVPYGATLKLVGVEGTLPDAEPAIRYHDESIAKTVLAHFLNLGQQMGTGSYALGATLGDFFTLGVQTVAQQIADVANSHVVEDLVDINFGEDEPAPRITFDEIGSRQAATAQALKLLIDAGVIHSDDILEESTRQQYGLPPRDPNAPPPGPLPGLTRETLTGPAPGTAPVVDPKAVAAGAADEPVDEDLDDDEATDALIAALAEFAGEVTAAAPDTPFNRKHPRNPDGKFRTVFDRVMNALDAWKKGDGHDDPLPPKDFNRAQLRTVAVQRGISLKRGAPREDIAKAILDDLKVKERDQRDNPTPKPSAKFTLKGGAPDPAKAREVEVENKIREAYNELPKGAGIWLGLADLREHPLLRDLPRTEVDAALLRGAKRGDMQIEPIDNRRGMTQRDRDAALLIGGDPSLPREMIHYRSPDGKVGTSAGLAPLLPLPKGGAHRNKDVGVYQESDGKVSLYEESGSGARGARVATVDDLAGLERWANDNGETELAHWARSEGGTPAGAHALLVARPGQPGLTAAQKAAVQRYTNSDVVTAQVNGILREDKPHTALIHRLDEAMASSRTTEPMMVFRGIAERPAFGQEGGTQRALGLDGSSLPESLVGHEWTEPSFASTSTRKGIAEVFSSGDNAVLLEIHIPKGTHAIARPGGEEEVLLDRGLTYRVTGDRVQTTMVGIRGDEPSHKRILEVEVVPATKARTEGGTPAVPAKKAAPVKTNEALLSANQERQAVIDKARVAGHMAADFAELDYNSGNPDVMAERLGTLAQKARDDVSHGAPLPDGLDKLEQAAATGDAAKMRRAVATFARANGITVVGKPGGRDKFDPSVHEAQGSRPSAGAAVEVIRPGVSTRHNGEDIQVTKPLVVDVSDEVTPAKRAPRKAVPKGDLTGANGLSSDPAVRDIQVENRVRAAYVDGAAQARGLEGWVGLADLRERLGGLSREEQDAALTKMLLAADYNDPGRVRIIPVANTKALKPRDRAAALRIGNEDSHAIWIGDPSPRPLPATDQLSAPANAPAPATPKVRALSALDAIAADISSDPRAHVPAMGAESPLDTVARLRARVESGDLPVDKLDALLGRMTLRFSRADGDPIGEAFSRHSLELKNGTPTPTKAIKKAAPAAKAPTASTPDATLATLRDLGSHDEVWSAASKMTVPQLKALMQHMGGLGSGNGLRKGVLVDRLAGTWPEMRVDAKPARTTEVKAPLVSPAAARAQLASATTREEARAMLAGMTVAQLRAIYPAPGVTSKADIIDFIVERTVGSRINSTTIRQL